MNTATVEYVPAGEQASYVAAGDLLLTMRGEFLNKVIRFWQRLKYRGDKSYLGDITHVATVASKTGRLIEAQWTGMEYTHIERYRDVPYYVVHIGDCAKDRRQMVGHLMWLEETNEPYGVATIISVGLSVLCGMKFHFSRGNSKICSGASCEGLFKGDHGFPVPAAFMMPADVADYFSVKNEHRG